MLINFKKIGLVIQLFSKAFGKHKKKVALTTVLGFVSGFLGGIGITVIIPLFALLTKTTAPGTEGISRFINSVFAFLHISISLPLLLLFLGAVFTFKAVFLYVANYLIAKASTDFERDIRAELLSDTLHASWPYLATQKMGHLSTIVADDVQGAAGIFSGVSGLILSLTSLITYAAIAMTISAKTTIMALFVGIILFFVFKPLFYRIRKLSQWTAENNKIISHHINEHILGAKTVKAAAVEPAVLEKSKSYFEDLRNTRLKLTVFSTIFSTFLEPISFIFVSIIFVVSYRDPAFNIASFAATLYLIQKMFSFFQQAQSRLNNINEMTPYLQNVLRYHETAQSHREPARKGADFTFTKMLAFEHVGFAYNPSAPILTNINFTIQKGETIGLIGPSGAGKTTIVDLFLRLLEPSSGSITIDNQSVSHISTPAWRSHIGYVSQDIFLLNDTVAANIRFYDSAVTDSQIAKAAHDSNIADFINSLPEKYETVVGERGIRLSGGQRQRIILARALAHRPQILVLDEATSSLDNESEAAIQRAIHNLRRSITIIIIAHRLTTVMNTDRLLILDKGSIVNEGAPEKLLADKDSYFHKMLSVTQS